jgi:hypothetical protein
LALTTAVDIAKPICQAQRAATGIVADMTTETQVLFLICANLRNLRIGCVTSVIFDIILSRFVERYLSRT